MDKLDPIVVSIVGSVVAVVAIIVGIVWATNIANSYYYETANKCIASGSQWLPMGPGAYNGFCIKNGDR